MKRAFALLLALAPLTIAQASAAGDVAHVAPPAATKLDGPCTGCKASIPAGPSNESLPLLVVLHGDYGQGPGDLLSAWQRHATARGVAVLALACPKDQGCDKNSWWQWNGDPAWLTTQIDALDLKLKSGAEKRSIDRQRMYLAGWSGGASYMGMRAQTLQRTFAALVYHGGGIAPFDSSCPQDAAPVTFLVGSGNPLHHLAVNLRRHHESCSEETVWKMTPKADHPAEWKLLETNGAALVSWMLTKSRKPTKS